MTETLEHKHRRTGTTLLECVAAFAVVAMTTSAVLALVAQARQVEDRQRQKAKAIIVLNNVVVMHNRAGLDAGGPGRLLRAELQQSDLAREKDIVASTERDGAGRADLVILAAGPRELARVSVSVGGSP